MVRDATDPEKAEFETQLARSLGLERHFSEAFAILDQVDRRSSALPERARIRSVLERGRCLRSGGEPGAARPLFVSAWERARLAGIDVLAIDAAHMVAMTSLETDALAWNRLALDLANVSPSPDARAWRTSLLNNIAWTYHDGGDYSRALDYFEQALDEARRGTDPEVARIAGWSVGRALRSLGRYPEALQIQRRIENQPAPGGKVDGYVLEEIAENLTALDRASEAQPYFARAYAALANDDELKANEPHRLRRMLELGEAPPRARP
jgi:tetratricopeptide (TPR) repeat protein